ncbi:MAG: bifunctional diaminohydroxyphosphoribosylaminopyrimidine deaminase/5-amino-6-(5-phosphoribosylamino)uracil reductase RibD [Bacteroidota bacterium]|nr:bifunctional diaminohydroxyphosphoribosylaminopyrimidine deaminase/5-amino-6-(5-phosphoribosylamino)uracil reductase RibD [Bacteroidota bacterium]
MKQHEIFMLRCIELAKNGSGNVAPNPLVGCVVVHEGKIIGEGYHRKYGEAHAEVNAISNVEDKSLLEKCTVYVNLEPCAHYGKTPPCADLLIKYKVPLVVIGCFDTFSEVSGKGIKKLENAGCQVIVGILEKQARDLNKRFFKFHEKKRPYVILKWAQTIDGYIDKVRLPGQESMQNKISSNLSQVLVHKWRSQEQAIMVGTNTALYDNPKLNVRCFSGNDPIRIVIDKNLRLPFELHLFDQSIPTLVFTQQEKESKNNLQYISINLKNLPAEISNELYNRNIQSLFIEGGSILINSFIEDGIWDEARVFISPMHYEKGIKAPVLKNADLVSTDTIEFDFLNCYKNNKPQ